MSSRSASSPIAACHPSRPAKEGRLHVGVLHHVCWRPASGICPSVCLSASASDVKATIRCTRSLPLSLRAVTVYRRCSSVSTFTAAPLSSPAVQQSTARTWESASRRCAVAQLTRGVLTTMQPLLAACLTALLSSLSLSLSLSLSVRRCDRLV